MRVVMLQTAVGAAVADGSVSATYMAGCEVEVVDSVGKVFIAEGLAKPVEEAPAKVRSEKPERPAQRTVAPKRTKPAPAPKRRKKAAE